MANRVVRQGSARLIRPLAAEALVTEVGEVLSSPEYREAARRAGRASGRSPIRYGCAMKRRGRLGKLVTCG